MRLLRLEKCFEYQRLGQLFLHKRKDSTAEGTCRCCRDCVQRNGWPCRSDHFASHGTHRQVSSLLHHCHQDREPSPYRHEWRVNNSCKSIAHYHYKSLIGMVHIRSFKRLAAFPQGMVSKSVSHVDWLCQLDTACTRRLHLCSNHWKLSAWWPLQPVITRYARPRPSLNYLECPRKMQLYSFLLLTAVRTGWGDRQEWGQISLSHSSLG